MKLKIADFCIALIFLGELGVFLFPDFKVLFWGLFFISIAFLPLRNLRKLNFKFGLLFLLIFIFAISNTLRGLDNRNGQTIISILGNPAFFLFEFAPIFVVLSNSNYMPYLLSKTIIWSVIISIFSYVMFDSFVFANVAVFFVAILIAIKRSTKINYVILAISIGLYSSIVEEYRLLFIAIVLFIPILILIKSCKSFRIFRRFSILYSSFLLGVPIVLIAVSVVFQTSVFQLAQDYFISSSSMDKSTVEDTRSFLFIEVFNDLNSHNALLLGKGSTGRIETVLSDEIDKTVINGERAFVEVLYLEFMRRGGLVYAFVFYLLLVASIIHSLRNSKNRFLLIISMSLSSFYFIAFIGINPVFSLTIVVFWILIGMCISKRWNNYSDGEIEYLFRFYNRKLI